MPERMVPTMRLCWLQAFLEVARCGSHTEAGKALGWSQSNVSRYIGNLERWLGYPLFTGFVPPIITSQGEAFLPVAEEVVRLLIASRSPELIDTPTASVWATKNMTEIEAAQITVFKAAVETIAAMTEHEPIKKVHARDIKF